MDNGHDWIGVIALSSAICSHLLARHHFAVEKSWYENKWFWAGLLGTIPALIAFIAHIFFSGIEEEAK
jgi:hypothetical protein